MLPRRPVAALTLILGIALAVAFASCSGGSSPAPATPTFAPASTPIVIGGETPTAAPESPGDDGFRSFARALDGAVRSEDIDFISPRLRTTPVDCSGADANQAGGPVCDYPGQRYDGMSAGVWRSEGGIVPASDVIDQIASVMHNALPKERDTFGDGAAQVYALNVEPGTYVAILAALITRPANFAGSGPLRVAIGTSWDYGDGRWEMTGVLYAYVLAEDLLQPKSAAPESPYAHWERFDE